MPISAVLKLRNRFQRNFSEVSRNRQGAEFRTGLHRNCHRAPLQQGALPRDHRRLAPPQKLERKEIGVMNKLITSTLVALSLGASTTPAFAETASVTVAYADLDLSAPGGIATLKGRIEAATKRICGSADIRNMHDVADQQRCMREVNNAADKQIASLKDGARLVALNLSSPHR
jgi:UrcA family protein